MLPLCIRGSTRTVSTLWDIPRSSPNLVIQTFLLILAWRNARCFHPVVSSILCYLTITLANSPFHSVSCVTKEMSKSSHGFATPTRSDLVHSRSPQGYWEGIHSRLGTRIVAFPDHSQRALQRLHEHVAQDQGRGQQVAKSPGWQSPEMSMTLGRLQRQRGSNRTRKRSRKIPDCIRWPRWC